MERGNGTWRGASDQLIICTRLLSTRRLRTWRPCMSLMARIDFSGDSKRSRPAHRLMPVLGSDSIRQDVTGPNACMGAAVASVVCSLLSASSTRSLWLLTQLRMPH